MLLALEIILGYKFTTLFFLPTDIYQGSILFKLEIFLKT